MKRLRDFLARNRVLAAMLCASLAAHAAILAGSPDWAHPALEEEGVRFEARLVSSAGGDGAAVATITPSAPAAPRRPRVRPATPISPIAMLDKGAALPALAEPMLLPEPASERPPEPAPEPLVIAAAEPSTVTRKLAPPKFDARALPERVKIEYDLKSAFADGQAEYTWSREGNQYSILGTMEAVGFFTLFLEGRILQESRGEVTADGLKPAEFMEKRGASPDEGLAFDWVKREVTFIKGTEKKTAPLTDNTVDWLTMIFQMAHAPPPDRPFDLKVFTQRRLYNFHLEVLGVEEIEVPLGKLRTLHLRHAGDTKVEQVDVWLGLDHHYLPVKMRFPVARNRLIVEQNAVRITGR
jgi:hypothetical protein